MEDDSCAQVSAMRRSAYNLICFFMVVNLLIIPGLSLSGLDEFLAATANVPIDRLLAQVRVKVWRGGWR